MDLDTFLDLLTERGRRALAEAVEATSSGLDPVVAATRLRKTYDPALSAVALTQAALRERARDKFGPDAAAMYFTRAGLEQSTRREVADHRARRLAAHFGIAPLSAQAALTAPPQAAPSMPPAASPNGPSVADLCCGIGGDMIALARAGFAVHAVDADPLTAAVARANAEALGLGDRVRVHAAEAASVDPAAFDAVFLDPARRTSRGRTFDPMAYSPAWPEVLGIVARSRAACLKVAPGIPDEILPVGAEAEWVSYRGEVKEAVIWCGPLGAGAVRRAGEAVARRATLLPAGLVLAPDAPEAPVGEIGAYLYEPDGAAIRAHLVAEVADMVRGRLIDPLIAYLTSDERVSTPWASCYEIHKVMPFSLKRLRAALRAEGVGSVTIKKRGSAVDIERLRKDLKLSGDKSVVVVLTRIGDRPFALICTPC
ncbi:Methyltransferase domain-containing protein [Sinosporangium album]|uniref:Methyltransferase domain-containing protein n=1 Tax=Sinosporangium album TaxID=504805 RepID=A0A1G8D161_9ACTN|nr:class I SAM-dependent methyltransferase [Sinosporangium album]SDH51284.1 Methyltransferase domain-containing protein [Sinosporangium album]